MKHVHTFESFLNETQLNEAYKEIEVVFSDGKTVKANSPGHEKNKGYFSLLLTKEGAQHAFKVISDIVETGGQVEGGRPLDFAVGLLKKDVILLTGKDKDEAGRKFASSYLFAR